MSQEQLHQQPFAESYPLPEDQLLAELHFVEDYSAQYPENARVLEHALSQLKQGANSMSSLYVRPPHDMPSRHDSGLSDGDYNRRYRQAEGRNIVGQPSGAEHALLEGLYSLTGAEVVRDDERDGEATGIVLRRGYIGDRPVFFEEAYSLPEPGTDDERTMKVFMLGAEWGNAALSQPSQSEVRRLVQAQGIDPMQANRFIADNSITRANLHQFLPGYEQDAATTPDPDIEQLTGRVALQSPNAPAFERGTTLDAEATPAFAEKIRGTILRLSRKLEPLTSAESQLVDEAINTGASSMRHMLEVSDVPLPSADNESYAEAVRQIERRLPDTARGYRQFGLDPKSTASALSTLINTSFVGREQTGRMRAEDLAIHVMQMFAEITRNTGHQGNPVQVDAYLSEKLTRLASSYDALKLEDS